MKDGASLWTYDAHRHKSTSLPCILVTSAHSALADAIHDAVIVLPAGLGLPFGRAGSMTHHSKSGTPPS